MTFGARLIDSTPPAMTTSASPDLMALAANPMLSIPDPHSRLMVAPGIESLSPASKSDILATLRLSSPA